MRTQLITSALAVAATSALVGLGADTAASKTPDPMTPGTTREVGRLLECTGHAGATPVRANLYENKTYGNHLELLVNDGTPQEAGASREVAKSFFTGTKVRASGKIKGTKIVITGTAKPTGKVKRVHEVVEDAGLRIVTTGTHRLLRPALEVSYGDETGRLSCDNAFAFRLKVTKTSMTD